MFNKKNTIIIALIAIFVLGSITLNALLRVEVWNVYSRSWGHDHVTWEATSQFSGYEVSRVWYYPNNLTPAMVAWNGIALGPGDHDYEAAQDTRSVTGEVHQSETLLKITLPGQWEPIPNNPPMQD